MKFKRKHIVVIFTLIMGVGTNIVLALNKIDLLDVKNKSIAGEQTQIMLSFSGQPTLPTGFSMDDPSKMIFDFAAVHNKIPRTSSLKRISSGVIKEINFVETEDKTRMIVDVVKTVPFTAEVDNNNIILTFNTYTTKAANANSVATKIENNYDIKSIDFHRGEEGEGKLIIELSSEAAPIDFQEVDNTMILEYPGATISEKLLRKFDVRDFGTPIKYILVLRKEDSVQFKIQATGDYDKAAYQLNKQYVIEVKPMSLQEKEMVKAQKFQFTGERISLNFQDIEIRAVLQLMADFTGLNIIASDSVNGNVTLRLDNVPWDQALDFILKSKGLGKRDAGNIILIAPNEEIASREQLELETLKQSETLVPLHSEFIQINYAKAVDIEKMLRSEGNSVLSARGVISVDERTNTLLVKDTMDKLSDVRRLIEKLDVPIRQVLIEAQVVQTKDNFTDAFGIHLGGASKATVGKYRVGIGGNLNAARRIANTGVIGATAQSDPSPNNNLSFFNFKQSDAQGKLGLAIGKLPGGTLLDIELRASELENKSKILARPKLMTLDQQTATIETGTEIPYSTTSQHGATPSVTFKKAVLKLEVKPQITPNNKVLMELTINQDRPGSKYNEHVGIDTTNIKTNILVDNGETVVLGGVFTVDQSKAVRRIPFLSEIPFLGRLFRDHLEKNDRQEILIFVTPRIIKQIATNQ